MSDLFDPILDADGNEVVIPTDMVTDDMLRLFFAGRVPAPNCPHYMAKSERDAGYDNCESCARGMR